MLGSTRKSVPPFCETITICASVACVGWLRWRAAGRRDSHRVAVHGRGMDVPERASLVRSNEAFSVNGALASKDMNVLAGSFAFLEVWDRHTPIGACLLQLDAVDVDSGQRRNAEG